MVRCSSPLFAVCALVLLTGCLGGLTSGDAVEERTYPDRPPELTEETVGPYVAEYEVVVSVGFYWTFGDDGSGQPTGIADGPPYEATYFVNESTTERLGDTL